MATEVIMPKIAESIFEGTLTRWLKKVGERVEQDEPLFEISTDKVDTEIPSPTGGVLEEILVREGETVAINTVVAKIGDSGRAVASAPPKPAAPKPPELPATPKPGSGPAPAPALPPPSDGGGKIFASPLVKKMAEKEGVDLSGLSGSGFKGRITKQDLIGHIQGRRSAPTEPPRAEPRPAAAAPPAPSQTREIRVAGTDAASGASIPHVITGPIREEKMSPMRRKIAEHMVLSRRTSAHVSTFWEADMSRVVALREKEKDYFEKVYGTRLTLTGFFVTAAIRAIKEFPVANASVEGDTIVYHDYVNMGVAVALPDGLIVPVIRGADEMSFLGLTRAINDVAERSRSKKLRIEEVQGGTFTITNPGVFGGLIGTPIIHQPQVAILGVGGLQKRAVVIGDAIAVRPMIYLTLSFDHRVIDGAIADQFMARVKGTLDTWDLPLK